MMWQSQSKKGKKTLKTENSFLALLDDTVSAGRSAVSSVESYFHILF